MADTTQQRAARLFKAALGQEPAARAAFLDQQCGNDAPLRHELESLLTADVRAGEFMERSPAFVQSLAVAAPDALVGQRVGGYRIVRQIGSGGMGTVYEAVQERLGRTVALKVVRSGLASPAALRRFEYEAKLLARLRHPAIAQIDEVGTHLDREGILGPAGGSVPYFAMEFVPNARTVVDYVREKGLTTRQRLELFVHVCDGVQYGHQRGVIHRDLKPSNILVGDELQIADCRPLTPDSGVKGRLQIEGGSRTPHKSAICNRQSAIPKIIDFGVARAVDTDQALTSLHTSYGQLVGTLQYMSPEQCGLDSHDIDVRSDIYSLGVVLFELLCGRPPYVLLRMTLPEATRVIREELPPRLSAVDRTPRGDLDTIVRKSLEKDRNRRYQSAGELAEDARRYLANEAISARPPSVTYQLRAFARRNRALVAGVAAVFLVLVAGILTTTWQAVRARRSADAARRSESSARQSEQLANLRLRDSLIAQARAIRRSGQPGQRFDAFEAVSKAAAIAPSLEARNEAIAALALPDLRPVRTLARKGTARFDPLLERCAISGGLSQDFPDDGSITVVRVADESVLAHIPPPIAGSKQTHRVALTGSFLARVYDPAEGNRRLEVWTLDTPLPAERPGRTATHPPAADRGVSRDATLHLELTDVPYRANFDFSPDGKRIAVGRLDQAIHIYDLASGLEVQRLPLDRNPAYVTFDPSGRRLALYHAGFNSARILDLETGRSEPAFDAQNVGWSVAWHPDGKLLAAAAGERIELWDAEKRVSRGVFIGHAAQVVHVCFSHDGTLLLSHSWEGQSFLWDTLTRCRLLPIAPTFPVFSPDDRMICGAVQDSGTYHVRLFELADAGVFRRLTGSGDAEPMVWGRGAFDPSSGLLFVGGATQPAELVDGLRVFDVARGRELAYCAGPSVQSLAMDPLGGFLLTGHDEGVDRWPLRADGQRLIVGPPRRILSVGGARGIALSADGGLAVAAGYSEGEFAVLNPGDEGEGRRVACSLRGAASIACTLSPDGHWVADHGWPTSAGAVWSVESGACVFESPSRRQPWLAFSPDGERLASGGEGGISLWEAGSWRLLRQVPGPFGWFLFSPDSRILAEMSSLPTIRLLDTVSLEVLASLEPPESFPTSGVAFSRDGSLLVQFSNRAGVVYVWDLRDIRRQLAALDLDWDHPPYPPAVEAPPVEWQVEIDGGTRLDDH